MEQRIKQIAEQLFFTYGLKNVSMDDIAREAGVSKKTIYQLFDDKRTIVLNIMSRMIDEQEDQLRVSLKNSENAVHEILLIAKSFQSLVLKLKPVLLFDLHRYFPDCWKMFTRFKEESLRTVILNNLKKGIAEGLYRKDVDFELVSQFALVQFTSLFNQDSYPANKFKSDEVIWHITELFLHGIGSSAGQLVIKNYLENKHHEHTS